MPHLKSAVALTLLCFAALSCSHAPSTLSRDPSNMEIALSHGDARVGSYTSSWNGFRTTSYWIEGPDGLVLIDTQFLLSAAEEMVDWAERVTGKKAKLAVILHPNPDKFNGTAVFQKRGIKVVTSQAIKSLIPSVHRLRMGWFYDRFKPDYPIETPNPDSFGSETAEIHAAGITLKAHTMGPGCSDAHVVVEFQGHVFVGDLVTQGFHSWLELGLLDQWLLRLEEIKKLKPSDVHTGRGGSGPARLLDRQAEYLKTVLSVVKKFKPRLGKALSDEDSESISNQIFSLYPSYDYPAFVENGIDAVWKRLSSKPWPPTSRTK